MQIAIVALYKGNGHASSDDRKTLDARALSRVYSNMEDVQVDGIIFIGFEIPAQAIYSSPMI